MPVSYSCCPCFNPRPQTCSLWFSVLGILKGDLHKGFEVQELWRRVRLLCLYMDFWLGVLAFVVGHFRVSWVSGLAGIWVVHEVSVGMSILMPFAPQAGTGNPTS